MKARGIGLLASVCLLASLLACLTLSLPLLAPRTQREKGEFGRRGEGGEVAGLPCLAPAPTLHVPPCLPASLSLALLTKKEWEGVGEGGKDESASLPPPSLPPAPSPPPLSLCPYRKKEKGRGSARVRESESKGREGQGAGCGWHCPARA